MDATTTQLYPIVSFTVATSFLETCQTVWRQYSSRVLKGTGGRKKSKEKNVAETNQTLVPKLTQKIPMSNHENSSAQ